MRELGCDRQVIDAARGMEPALKMFASGLPGHYTADDESGSLPRPGRRY